MGKEKRYICKAPHQDSGYCNISYTRYAENLFTQNYKDLNGDAIPEPIQMGTNMATGHQQKHLSLIFATKT